MKKWEYSELENELPYHWKDLNSHGEDGWELCGVVYNEENELYIHYLKRELISKPELKKI